MHFSFRPWRAALSATPNEAAKLARCPVPPRRRVGLARVVDETSRLARAVSWPVEAEIRLDTEKLGLED